MFVKYIPACVVQRKKVEELGCGLMAVVERSSGRRKRMEDDFDVQICGSGQSFTPELLVEIPVVKQWS